MKFEGERDVERFVFHVKLRTLIIVSPLKVIATLKIKKSFFEFFYLTSALGAVLRTGGHSPHIAINANIAIVYSEMKKKQPGEKSIVTGVSLPPDLHAWVTARVKESSKDDPTRKRSASAIVQQALLEYRARVEQAESKPPPKGKAKSTTAAVAKSVAGAKTIKPSAIYGTSSSTAGTGLYRRAG